MGADAGLDPFGAFVALCPDAEGKPAAGFRVAVKDMIAVEGMPQPSGICARKGICARIDAPVVTRFREAGHTIVGVTASDAAGFGTMTDAVINPTHPTRAVGGSSGGSAAAVAAGLADVGLGTDTGGSVRIPAAYCGLYAFKPSQDRVPLTGVLPLSPALDHVGLIAASPSVLATASRHLLGAPKDAGPQPAPRLALASEAFEVCDGAVSEPFAALTDGLRATPFHSPIDDDALSEAASLLVCAEAFAVHAELWAKNPAGFPPLVAMGLAIGERLSVGQIREARGRVDAAGRAWRAALAHVDVLLCPTLPMTPADRYAATVQVRGKAWPITNANIRLCQFANAAGLPVVVAPINGQSIQFIGRVGEDETLIANALALAERLERASD